MFSGKEGVVIFAGIVVLVLGASVLSFFASQKHSDTIPPVACTMEAKLCPDGSSVGRTGPDCAFALCPVAGSGEASSSEGTIAPGGGSGGGGPVVCAMDALACPDGSYVSRIPPSCIFAACPSTQPRPSGSCKSDADCATGYECTDISPVVREGYENLQCWKIGSPRPICLSGETRIATPIGDVPVKNIHKDDLVWSVNAEGKKVAVPVRLFTHTEAPTGHQVVHLTLADGRELFVSPRHKVADNRMAGSLLAGDSLEHSVIILAKLVPYDEPYTYDILPDSETGMYWGNDILLQSTLKTN